MRRWSPLLLLLVSIASCQAGQYLHFDAPLGPGERVATLHGYHFNQKTESLRVIDRQATKLAPWKTLGDAFTASRALAGCNGGFTQPDGMPLGIVISDSVRFGQLESKAGPASGLVVVKWNSISLLKAADATEANLLGATQAIQGGPFLIEGGKSCAGLDSKSFSRRTVLISSGSGEWAILYAPSATLQGLARLLGDGKSFTSFHVETALNLGGGLSSSMWIQLEDGAQPIYLREVDPVRTGIAVIPK